MYKFIKKQRKFFAILVAVIVVFTLYFTVKVGTIYSHAEEMPSGTNTTGLGLSVNAVTTNYLDLSELKDNAYVFDSQWLDEKVKNSSYYEVCYLKGFNSSSSDFYNIAKDYCDYLNYDANVTGGANLFTDALSYGFNYGNEYNSFANLYFYYRDLSLVNYTLSLPNYKANISEYVNNLSFEFISALDKVFSGKISYAELFDTFGTHVIMKGEYGGLYSFFYAAASNSQSLGGANSDKITAALDNYFNNITKGEEGQNFDISEIIKCNKNEVQENSYSKASGGMCLTDYSICKVANKNSIWQDMAADNPALVSTTFDGLVPLWELLPEKYSAYKADFKNAFVEYANDYNNSIYKKYPHSVTFTRDTVYCIDDAGPMVQKYDRVACNDMSYSIDELVSQGYNYVNITVSIDMKEKNKGYQQVFLYPYQSTKYNQKLTATEVEYGGKKRVKNYSNVTFCFKSLDINNFKDFSLNGKLAFDVRYGATGFGEDSWYNKNACITVTFSRGKAVNENSANGTKVGFSIDY